MVVFRDCDSYGNDPMQQKDTKNLSVTGPVVLAPAGP
jgi:hypothetical protein